MLRSLLWQVAFSEDFKLVSFCFAIKLTVYIDRRFCLLLLMPRYPAFCFLSITNHRPDHTSETGVHWEWEWELERKKEQRWEQRRMDEWVSRRPRLSVGDLSGRHRNRVCVGWEEEEESGRWVGSKPSQLALYSISLLSLVLSLHLSVLPCSAICAESLPFLFSSFCHGQHACIFNFSNLSFAHNFCHVWELTWTHTHCMFSVCIELIIAKLFCMLRVCYQI